MQSSNPYATTRCLWGRANNAEAPGYTSRGNRVTCRRVTPFHGMAHAFDVPGTRGDSELGHVLETFCPWVQLAKRN